MNQDNHEIIYIFFFLIDDNECHSYEKINKEDYYSIEMKKQVLIVFIILDFKIMIELPDLFHENR